MSIAATERLKELAVACGFSRAGVARAHARPDDERRLRAWLDKGMNGEMQWLARNPGRRSDPTQVVDHAQSVIVLALDYDSGVARSDEQDLEGRGFISRYALGRDYHKVIEKRLKRFTAAVVDEVLPMLPSCWREELGLQDTFDPTREFRWSVDYGPVLERQWAQEAGLGWQGKNSLLIHPRWGSYFFLSTVITTLPLRFDTPAVDHCSKCRACMDACPTGAIVQERVVDARRCISYLTIEKRGELTPQERESLGDQIFGCDICQEVCPYNRVSTLTSEPDFEPVAGRLAPKLVDLLSMDAAEFADRFQGSAVKRTKLQGLQRNARAVLANQAQRAERRGSSDRT